MNYEQLAEAHQRIADAHANMAGLLQGRCVQPTFLVPEAAFLVPEAAPPAPQQPAKLRAPEGALFTSRPDWRQFIIRLERQLREHFGTDPIYMRRLREFLAENHVELLPGDMERCPGQGHKSPRWFGNLQSALNCRPVCWPHGRPVIVPAGIRGYYRLT